MTLLDNLLSSTDKTHVVIVPSLRDAHHQFVYPQPPFSRKKTLEAFQDSAHGKVSHVHTFVWSEYGGAHVRCVCVCVCV